VTVHLVRHAKAGDRERWNAPDDLRPLSSAGLRQAEGLVALLAPARPARILSSPSARCVQTVEPLAHFLGMPVELSAALAEGTGAGPTMKLVAAAGGTEKVVLCTHGDVILEILEQLLAHGVDLGSDEPPLKKGSTWALEVGPRGTVRSATYLPPPA
jgi:broad specificity phosphatase PhoE